MKELMVIYHEEPKLRTPILVEGLPGVGNVGKLAAEHLIMKLKAKKFASIYSKHFPPQVLIGNDGVIRLVSNDLYYHKTKSGSDIIILSGDYQGISQEGQYDISHEILDIFERYKGKRIYTLGGWSVGKLVNQPRVLGATTTLPLVKELKAVGVEFSKDEPAGGIVGAAGLLLGLGQLRNIEAACLMGETSGYFSDPKSAQAILEILGKLIGVKIDFTELEQHSKEIDDLTASLNDMKPPTVKPDELKYIG
ncbi:MAG: proteasome assembly chaperone family protein [Candidatus Thermoplasmatota archaeon]|nr:proteasome assembly chaperone family protein [Euryarchaeota archaeon]MBU4031532.1 proteasome assembly chaperone family protein [Candidatus Thermoplasmatota archaeon]MBU4071995.1 proteasome assembly chaperone family protein [Candidatus Thermoplasmatota archaeon]MBU4144526.1 proteasome assembly chaperone family protein [Candidatus Thermoplasmatota archaeon]MBU4592075.1 proteasome assembly chaperone family protein [Candidatus Thermoplasmatota archaeon]